MPVIKVIAVLEDGGTGMSRLSRGKAYYWMPAFACADGGVRKPRLSYRLTAL